MAAGNSEPPPSGAPSTTPPGPVSGQAPVTSPRGTGDKQAETSAPGPNIGKRIFTNKTVQTLVVAALTAVVTTFSTVATGWLNYPLDKKKAELAAELQKQ